MIRVGSSVSDVLRNHSQEQLWSMALGFFPGANRFSNPFRQDDRPDCYLKWQGERLRMYDWGSDQWNGIDVLEALKIKWGYNYVSDVVNHLAKNLPNKENNISPTSRTALKQKPVEIDIRTVALPKFSNEMMRYWNLYGVYDEEFLRSNNVYPVKEAWFNTRTDSRLRKLSVPSFTFSLFFPQTKRQKLYSPLSPYMKWYGNTTHQDVYGLDSLLGLEKLLITSSCKDMIVLKQIRNELQLPIDIIAPNGEGMIIKEGALDILSRHHDIRKAYLWYDLDKAGLNYSIKHSKLYGCSYVRNPFQLYPIKDPSDLVKHGYTKEVEKILCSLTY